MRLPVLALSLAALPLPTGIASAREQGGEAALAKAIGDRRPGKPVDCIDPQQVRSTRIIGGTAIVYDTGARLYVNRPQAGAGSLRSDDVLISRIEGGQLCRIDTIRLDDAVTRMQRGFVVLGDFVPYERRR